MPTYQAPGVYVEEVASSSRTLSAAATAVAAFVGFTEKYPTDDPNDPEGTRPRQVTSWSQFERLYGGFTPGAMLPHSVYGYFNNGGSRAYIVRIPNRKPPETPGMIELESADRKLKTVLEITTKEAADDVEVVITNDANADGEPPTFTLTVTEPATGGGEPTVVKSYPGVTLLAGKNNVETVVNGDKDSRIQVATKVDTSKLIADLARIPDGNYPAKFEPGEVVKVGFNDFNGSAEKRKGISGLVIADDVTMVVVPDLITACRNEDGSTNLNLWKAVQTAIINHCELHGGRMAVLDAPPGMDAQTVKEWRVDDAGYNSPYATLYYPWIKVANPIGTNGDSEIFVPPSGHIAGLWARVDETRGVWKAPANEVVRGALKVETQITKAEQETLNPIGVNCIRTFGTRGILVWGARTLTDNTDWRYVNVRRLFNMIETTILEGTQFAVFEPNDVKLWEGLKRTVGSFLLGLWRDGALFGTTAEQAFYVKCDAETNPPESIDEGKVVVEVGIAPVKPAEFVIFRIAQIKQSST